MTWAPCPHGVRTRGKKRFAGEKLAVFSTILEQRVKVLLQVLFLLQWDAAILLPVIGVGADRFRLWSKACNVSALHHSVQLWRWQKKWSDLRFTSWNLCCFRMISTCTVLKVSF